ncbi:MAG: DUF3817 domain-containing protein [Gammaproteobacteria bacterium]|nr:DUF3817 domain-containing protein [Gammaproteobacteria bacterium]MCF6231165.1 DUF3817 domain-containing protein [Gammaproteobacteria bacterium]
MKIFRLISFVEGISLIVLLGVAMPLKYQFGIDSAVFYAGITHGTLFLIYMVASLSISHQQGWSIIKWLAIFLAGIFPFGFLIVDSVLKQPSSFAAAVENS